MHCPSLAYMTWPRQYIYVDSSINVCEVWAHVFHHDVQSSALLREIVQQSGSSWHFLEGILALFMMTIQYTPFNQRSILPRCPYQNEIWYLASNGMGLAVIMGAIVRWCLMAKVQTFPHLEQSILRGSDLDYTRSFLWCGTKSPYYTLRCNTGLIGSRMIQIN